MDTSFFQERKFLVIGGAGFIGSHLVDGLVQRNAKVTVLDNLCSGRLENLDLTNPSLSFLEMDIGAQEQSIKDSELDKLIAESDFVYHMASPIGVGLAHKNGFETTKQILKDGLNVVDSCLRHRKPILYTSSSEIYGLGGERPLDESDTAGFGLQPRWGYGAAKMALEHLVAGLKREHGLPAWSVRFFNVVGPRQNPKSGLVVSAFCSAALAGEDIIVHGDGSDRRTFLHVVDGASALIAIPQSDELQGKSINVGGVENISIRELAELVVEIGGKGEIVFKPHEEVYGEDFAPVNDRRPKLDLLMGATGWKPQYTLEQAIEGCFRSMREEAQSK